LQPSTGGCFELSVGQELIYSKLATGEFPDEAAMVKEVGKRLVDAR
jgi:selT/selW/selH-like putative selenoprotein